MVDDAHLLDDLSAALLLSIARDRQEFVIATLRAGRRPRRHHRALGRTARPTAST
jgi:hypothetical protein